MSSPIRLLGPGLVVALAAVAGCSIERLAINSLSGILAEGNSVFERDNDPQLIAEALPLSLKLMDALLLEQPDNVDLLLAAASGYVFYAYANVSIEAERISRRDIDAARALRDRAANLFLRAHAYASSALATEYPQLPEALLTEPDSAVRAIEDGSDRTIEMLYWTAASLGLAISSARNDPSLIARSGEVEALLERALDLDASWDDGSLHEFAISAAALTGIDRAAIDTHFERARALSGGKRASLYIAYAEATAIPSQDRSSFVDLLEKALAVPIEDYPELTLVNTVAQERATWLLGQLDMLFLE
jgi:predicted anti-sigma-YlaC factor YlaD